MLKVILAYYETSIQHSQLQHLTQYNSEQEMCSTIFHPNIVLLSLRLMLLHLRN